MNDGVKKAAFVMGIFIVAAILLKAPWVVTAVAAAWAVLITGGLQVKATVKKNQRPARSHLTSADEWDD